MNRRTFLSAGGTALAGVVGCLNIGSEDRFLSLIVVNHTEEEISGAARLLVEGDVIGVLEFELPTGNVRTSKRFVSQISTGTDFIGEVTVNNHRHHEATFTADCDIDEWPGDAALFRVHPEYIQHRSGCISGVDDIGDF